ILFGSVMSTPVTFLNPASNNLGCRVKAHSINHWARNEAGNKIRLLYFSRLKTLTTSEARKVIKALIDMVARTILKVIFSSFFFQTNVIYANEPTPIAARIARISLKLYGCIHCSLLIFKGRN